MLNFRIVVFAASAVMGSAQALGQGQLYDREMRAYVKCNVEASRSFARQPGDPLSLALAARGICGKEQVALSNALLGFYPPSQAARMLAGARQQALEHNTATIAKERVTADLSRGCKQNKDPDVAVRTCTELIRRNSTDGWAYAWRGRAYEGKGDYPRAIVDLTKAIGTDPKNALFYVARGDAYEGNGEPDRAIADYTKALEVDPRLAAAYTKRGIAYELNGNIDRAFADLDRAITLSPKDAIAYGGRGRIYLGKGETNRAISDLTQAIEINPADYLAFAYRGNAWRDRIDYDRAITDYSEAIKLNPKFPALYVSRGEVHERKGDLGRAMVDFRTVVTLPATSEKERQFAQEALTRLRGSSPPVATVPPPSFKHAPGTVETTTSGTGFLISADGRMLTNAHVVRSCRQIQVSRAGLGLITAHLVAADETNDLALLQLHSNIAVATLPAFRSGIRVGENVFAYGFPLADLLANSGNFTSGSITASAGLKDDITKLQFSAPVQPGNSGGALFDKAGNVVAVVVGTLKVVDRGATVPQNVNFAIRAAIAVEFIHAHGGTAAPADPDARPLLPEEIAERAVALSVRVRCVGA